MLLFFNTPGDIFTLFSSAKCNAMFKPRTFDLLCNLIL